ncbi:HNH endonuclease signature motif containing protein [Massilia sp.]|uniref:HNH endonuclease n=1 Tax=Massilia sp. TaxID=1882437 RepID=UPI00289DCED8|nr:HNH endonuclease signature motif containing protein [Massilia sp.]
MVKLRTLQPRLQPARVNRLTAAPAATAERKRGSAGVADRNRIRKRDCGLCQACKAKGLVALGVAVDHKVPLWAGGSDDDSNKWLLCQPCHDAKTAEEARQRAAGGLTSG